MRSCHAIHLGKFLITIFCYNKKTQIIKLIIINNKKKTQSKKSIIIKVRYTIFYMRLILAFIFQYEIGVTKVPYISLISDS